MSESTATPEDIGNLSTEQKKESFLKRATTRVKANIKDYLRNLDPRDKPFGWWIGSVPTAVGTATSMYLTPGIGLATKAALRAGINIGAYSADKFMFTVQKKKAEEKFAGSDLLERIKILEQRHEKGTGRIRQVLRGIIAGSIYGSLADAAVHVAVNPSLTENKLKHIVPKATNTSINNLRKPI